MSDKFENQKEQLVSLKHEISLLHQQVSYLLRNEKALELLDLDVLMNRTHTVYDLLCSINIGEDVDEEDLPFDAETLSGLFGGVTRENVVAESEANVEEEPETESDIDFEPEPEMDPDMEIEPEVEPELSVEEAPMVDESRMEPQKEVVVEPKVEILIESQKEIPVEPKEEIRQETFVMPPAEPAEAPIIEEQAPEVTQQLDENEPLTEEEKPLGDEFGFFFRFEDAPEKEEPAKNELAASTENEGKVVHVMEEIPEEEIPLRDRVHGDELIHDNPFEMPKMDEESHEEEQIEKQTSETVSEFFTQDDAEFELSTVETLGEKMIGEDHSLAAKLQQTPGRDLKSVIGINDKFLFVNELFGGSMEKYNKSIENLNDLKTLNGAMIYLNELKIELQWNSSNEAYQKLKDLISRKFES